MNKYFDLVSDINTVYFIHMIKKKETKGMKKIIKLFTIFLLSFGMFGCGNNTDAETETKVSKKPKSEITFESETLYDNDYGNFIVQSISENGDLKVSMENKTDSTLMYSLDHVSINGLMENPFWAREVTSGNKANDTISFYSLKEDGIDTISYITFTLIVSDSENWNLEPYIKQEFTLYPYGENQVKEFERKSEESDVVLFNNEQISVIVDHVEDDSTYGYSLFLYLENKTDQNLIYHIDNASVNGIMVDPFWAIDIPSGKKAYSEVSWYKQDLQDNEIDTIEYIDMPFVVSNYDTYSILFEQTLTYKP